MPNSIEKFNDIYIKTELMEFNLDYLIQKNKKLKIEFVQFIIYQILLGVNYMHIGKVVHRDLVII